MGAQPHMDTACTMETTLSKSLQSLTVAPAL
jgi:hypothetical protein